MDYAHRNSHGIYEEKTLKEPDRHLHQPKKTASSQEAPSERRANDAHTKYPFKFPEQRIYRRKSKALILGESTMNFKEDFVKA